jgi:hypothetical protein
MRTSEPAGHTRGSRYRIENRAAAGSAPAPPQLRHRTGGHHEFVNGFIMLPNCRQARAKLECDPEHCCLRARSAVERRNSQPPSPPEFGWIGPVGTQVVAMRVRVRVRFNPNDFRAGASRPVFLSALSSDIRSANELANRCELAHVPEKWEPVFRRGHARGQKNLERIPIRPERYSL